jgi:hypothetical protein
VSDVADDELPLDGNIERGAHDHVDLEDGLGCETLAVSPAARCQRLVERVEAVGPQPAQRHVADRWVHVPLDEPRVAVGGRRSHVAPLVRHPRVGQEPAEGDRPALDRARRWVVVVEARRARFGLAPVMPDRMPPTAFLAGERVDAVVGDDIEAVLALNDVGHDPQR